jgi:hypothetical protein
MTLQLSRKQSMILMGSKSSKEPIFTPESNQLHFGRDLPSVTLTEIDDAEESGPTISYEEPSDSLSLAPSHLADDNDTLRPASDTERDQNNALPTIEDTLLEEDTDGSDSDVEFELTAEPGPAEKEEFVEGNDAIISSLTRYNDRV